MSASDALTDLVAGMTSTLTKVGLASAGHHGADAAPTPGRDVARTPEAFAARSPRHVSVADATQVAGSALEASRTWSTTAVTGLLGEHCRDHLADRIAAAIPDPHGRGQVRERAKLVLGDVEQGLTGALGADPSSVRMELQKALAATAAKEADAAGTAGAGLDPSPLPPVVAEGSAPSMLNDTRRTRFTSCFLALALCSLVAAVLVVAFWDGSGTAATSVIAASAAPLCIVAAWFTAMGYGNVKIRVGTLPTNDGGK